MKWSSTICYVALIVLINNLFYYAPSMTIWGAPFSCADFSVGVVYIMRDFSQRELGHKVIFAMIFGCVASYLLAEKNVAMASLVSFAVGEFIDWAIYSYTKKPLSQRLLLSALICAPFDSVIFLYLMQQLNIAGLVVLSGSKMIGVMAVWFIWRYRARQAYFLKPDVIG